MNFRRQSWKGTAMMVARHMAIALAALLGLAAVNALAGGPEMEAKLKAAYEAGKLEGLHSVLVLRCGDPFAEIYFSGEDQSWGQPLGDVDHGPGTLHDLRSVTKSVVGLLYGIALDEGLVPDVDAGLIEQFPEYADLAADPQRAKITVGDALSMQMGTDWDESLPYSDPRNSEIAMELADDRYRFVLDRPMVQEPGTQWTYNGGATAIIAKLIADGTGMPIDQYAKQRLFGPLGITEFAWAAGSDGVPSAASGLRLTTHDLAKIGQMVMNGGTWKGKPVVPEAWVEVVLTPHAKTDELRYGYFWWLAPEGDPPTWVAGFGNGGQRLWINKPGGLVMVVFAGNYNQPDAWKVPVAVTLDFLLPEFGVHVR
jgi:CubicO group peptidase (beta-lactamase class C family)